MSDAERIFEDARPRLARLAYRMLGSLADADDVLQEAFLRFTREDRGALTSPAAYLNSIVVRLCIDRRRTIEAPKSATLVPGCPSRSSKESNAIRRHSWNEPSRCRWP